MAAVTGYRAPARSRGPAGPTSLFARRPGRRGRARCALAAVVMLGAGGLTLPAQGDLAALAPEAVGPGLAALPMEPLSVYAEWLAALGPCAAAHDCVRHQTHALVGDLVEDMRVLPTGREGPLAWLRFAAGLAGTLPDGPIELGDLSAEEAILAIYREAGLPVEAALRADVQAQVDALSPATSAAFTPLVNAVLRAHLLATKATRGVDLRPLADPERAAHLVTFVGSAPPGTTAPALVAEYERVIATLQAVDMALMSEAALVLATALAGLDDDIVDCEIDLPLIFCGGEGDTVHTDYRVLLVDVSGNDTYLNNAGGNFEPPVLNAVENTEVFGAVLAIDLGDGDDRYEREAGAQGFGFAGAGLLYNEGGSNDYVLGAFGQGSSVAGVGLLYGAGEGDNAYRSDTWGEDTPPIGQTASALGGLGILVDEGGSNLYHQDGLDGLIWGAAGGLALLASLGDGDDTYLARSVEVSLPELGIEGTFAGPVQVSAEAYGVTVLYDEGGNDTYICGEWIRQGCQAAAGVGALSLLIDLAGNDIYWMGDSIMPSGDLLPTFPMGQGAGYALAIPPGYPAIGVLYDEAGDDIYVASRWAQGYGSWGGIGILYDTGGGDDTYVMLPPLLGVRGNDSSWIDGVLGFGLDE